MNYIDYEDNLEMPTLDHFIAVAKITAFKLKNLKSEIVNSGINWISEYGKKNKEEFWSEDKVYWSGAKVQVVKSQDDANAAWGYSRRRVITKHPYFISGLFCLVAKGAREDQFVQEYLDPCFNYELYHAIADYIDDHKIKSEMDININYVNSFLDHFIDFAEHFYDIKPLVKEELFKEFSTCKNNNFYFAYGSNMDPRQMHERCPGAVAVGIGNLPFYKTIINSRGVASIVNSSDSFCPGVLWSVSDKHIDTLDKKEGVRHGTYTKEARTIKVKNIEVKAIVYIASKNDIGKPRNGYMEKLIYGANYFKFGNEYYSYLESLK